MKSVMSALIVLCGFLFSGISLADGIDMPKIPNPLPQTATSTDEGKLSLGASMGSTDGVSMLYRYAPGSAVQGNISLSDEGNKVSVDKIFTKADMLRSPYAVPYYGVGLVHESAMGDDSVGVRFPMGVMLNLPESPLSVSLEMAPVLTVDPEMKTRVEKTMAVRYAF